MKFVTDKFEYRPNCNVYGLTKELSALYMFNYFQKNDENVLILTSSLYEANNFYKMLQAYTDDVLFFPMDDFLTSVAIAVSPDLKMKRLETLEQLKKNKKKHIVVTSLMGYLKYLPNLEEEQSLIIDPSPQIISREIILTKLEEFGYKRDSLVTVTGEYAVRGYIIDIFPVDATKPIRIEFFDEEIESIKEFDEETQRSTKVLDKAELRKFNESISDTPNSLLDYLGNQTLFLIDESQIKNSYINLQKDIFEYKTSKEIDPNTDYMFEYEKMNPAKTYKVDTINAYNDKNALAYSSKSVDNFNSNMQDLKAFCLKELKKNTIIFALETQNQIHTIQELFEETYLTNEEKLFIGKINIIEKKLYKGFIFDKYVLITPNDIDKTIKKEIKYRNSIKIGRKVKSFSDLTQGDYIVHEAHGIGIYRGLKTLTSGGYTRDYIELEYQGNDKVYVPIDGIDKLYKYASNPGTSIKLSKLNSAAWAKKKNETRKKIRDISGELIELYSSRNKIQGPAYKDYEEEIKFALDFPYALTRDQEKTIKEIDADLKQTAPMDRLLCGDVGYGKTEVAFRAMFKAVINGFQVAYLCPTTILSKQQYTSALERFKDFPIKIALLNRYVSQKNVTRILNELREGKIDIIIGTHKLLNDQIEYKKLGLLVIDEEQRFGVTHKEKIKKIKNDVNVLTLSATPIPRTLKMAMSGLRSLSVLDTPPINRYPIQTYVIEENDLIMRDAIYKELTRNGQTFILINSINELERFKNKLQKLIPEANIICGHGQMSSEELGNIMESFIKGDYDILICTTIIETGIDIPNVNTIIIIDSDKFGLSQLYQIRGRVGRSDKIAYAYLMYNPAKVLTETAMRRLDSIKEFTELGSGYKIAMRDLAIRGAGDFLGSEQAGFIDAVGLDLYTKMVDEEVKRLSGDEIENKEETGPSLHASTYISNDYVDDENIKIEIHKMINTINDRTDFQNVKAELEDRFGKIDEELEIYMLKKCVEGFLDRLGVKKLLQLQNKVTVVLPEEVSNKIDGEKLFLQSYSICPKFEISYKNKEISITLVTSLLKKNYIYYLFELLNAIIEQIN